MGGASGPKGRLIRARHFTSRLQEGRQPMTDLSENGVEILLVEDNPNDVELTLDALRENKLTNRIEVVRDGAEALDFIFCTGNYSYRSMNHQPKLILLDLKLPKVSGMEVLEKIR